MKTLKQFLYGALVLVTICFPGRCVLRAQTDTRPEQPQTQAASTNEIGIRLGSYTGVDYRHFSGSNLGFEISLMNWIPEGGTIVSGLIEKKFPLKSNFELFFGGGLFAGNYFGPYPDSYYVIDGRAYVYHGNAGVGLEGVIGADYLIPQVPLAVGVELRPRIGLFVYPFPWDAGLNIRYRFK